jgi:RNA polymerase sigma-70 factor (ECF subfamily)
MTDLLTEHLPRLYRLAWMLTGNEADAQDLTQDTMVSALGSLGRFRAEAQISTWLTTILVNRHRTWLRRHRVRARILPRLASTETAAEPHQQAQQAEEVMALQGALDRLDDDERTVLALSVYQGLDSTEIGKMVGQPPGTVRWQLHQAREKLRGILQEKP